MNTIKNLMKHGLMILAATLTLGTAATAQTTTEISRPEVKLPALKPDILVRKVYVMGRDNYARNGRPGTTIHVDRSEAKGESGGKYIFQLRWEVLCVANSSGPFTNSMSPSFPLSPSTLSLSAGGVGVVSSDVELSLGPNTFTFNADDPNAVAESVESNNTATLTIVVH
ncbi:MAG: hypothetical protein IT211_12875 [Armatimonadetes bacterium]|nr:hypothetical protein [Armatimonadota bacterium]